MVNYIIITTTAMLIILGFAVELAAVAERVSEKAIEFSEDMNLAIDCAITGRPIGECSPNLAGYSPDFKEEATGLITKIEEMQESANKEDIKEYAKGELPKNPETLAETSSNI